PPDYDLKNDPLRLIPEDQRDKVSLTDCNMVSYDYEVRYIPDGPNKGKYEIVQTIVPLNVPFWDAHNIRVPGAFAVGKPMPSKQPIIVTKDDFVPVFRDGGIELRKVDDLTSLRSLDQFMYVGEKVLGVALDLALLASGAIGLRAAAVGGKVAYGAAQ